MKRGFTLIELLGIIVLLSLISILAIPRLINLIKTSSNKVEDITDELIIEAAKLYVEDNKSMFNKENQNKYCIRLNVLYNNGILSSKMDLENKNIMSQKSVEVLYNNGYSYRIIDNNSCNNLYTIVNEKMINIKNKKVANYRIYGYENGLGTLIEDKADSNYGKYKITLKQVGKNLLKTKGVSCWHSTITDDLIESIISNSAMKFNTDAYYGVLSGMTLLKKNTKYIYGVYFIEGENNDELGLNISAYKSGQTNAPYFHFKTYTTKKDQYKSFTTDSSNVLYGFATNGSSPTMENGVAKYKLYVYEVLNNEIDTTYEPYKEKMNYIYLEEPLRCFEDVCDYLDYQQGIIYRKISSDNTVLDKPKVDNISLPKIENSDEYYNIFVLDNNYKYADLEMVLK